MVVHIRGGKGRKDRDVMLSPKLSRHCASTGAGCGASLRLAVSRNRWHTASYPVTTKVFGQPASALHNALGLTQAHHPHTLRHCFGHPSARSRRDLRTSRCCSVIGPRGDDDLLHLSRRHLSARQSTDALTIRGEGDRHRTHEPPPLRCRLVRCAGQSFIERSRKWINGQHEKVLLGPSHAAAPPRWVDIAISARTADILPSRITRAATGIAHGARATPACAGSRHGNGNCCHPLVHVVFTLPREPLPRIAEQAKLIYNLLFHASAETLLEIARDPPSPGAEIASSACSIPGSATAASSSCSQGSRRWRLAPTTLAGYLLHHSFFLPVKVLSRVFPR